MRLDEVSVIVKLVADGDPIAELAIPMALLLCLCCLLSVTAPTPAFMIEEEVSMEEEMLIGHGRQNPIISLVHPDGKHTLANGDNQFNGIVEPILDRALAIPKTSMMPAILPPAGLPLLLRWSPLSLSICVTFDMTTSH